MKHVKRFGTLGLSVLMIASASLLTNCKKDKKTETTSAASTPAPQPPSNTEKLTGKLFKMTAMTVSPGLNFGGVVITDLYAQLFSCFKDNTTLFNTDKTVVTDEGPTKCDPADPQTSTGTWLWSTDEKILTVKESASDPGTSYTVITNDGTTLKVSFQEEDGGINYTYTITYTK